jgi:hypothetical protein
MLHDKAAPFRTPNNYRRIPVLAKNFGVSEQAVKPMPQKGKIHFHAPIPGPLIADQ